LNQDWTGEHSGAKVGEACASVHLAFNGFQAVNLAFGLAVAPLRFHGGSDGGDIFSKTIGEADQRAEATAFCIFNPAQ